MELFHLDNIKTILVTVLFIFSKEHQEIGYKQGMNEICGIFLYVLNKKQIINPAFLLDENAFLYFLFHSNNDYLEHDCYIMFNKFMSIGFINFFRYSDEKYNISFLSNLDPEQKKNLTKQQIINSDDSEIKKRIFLLYYDKFPLIDKNLFKFMSEKVDPELFIFRWFLCVFTREFPLEQVVHLWDLVLMFEFLEEKKNEEDKKNNNNHNKKESNNFFDFKWVNFKFKKSNSEQIDDKKIIDNKINDNLHNNNNKDIHDNKNINVNIINESNNNNEIKIENNNKIIENNNISNNNLNIININNDIQNIKNSGKNMEDNYKYNFIDCIALSMIIKLKNLIIKKKNSNQLISLLMKYPQDVDLKDICQKAIDIYHKINPKMKI
jgi:hypothetical protein